MAGNEKGDESEALVSFAADLNSFRLLAPNAPVP